MAIPRKILFGVWVPIVAFAYYALAFTNLGNYYHGGGAIDHALVDAIIVAGAWLSLEVFRTERSLLLKIVSGFFGVPLMCFAAFSVWYAFKYIFSF